MTELKVAIVHYWFKSRRGGERVVEALAELFPQADVFTLLAEDKCVSPALKRNKFTTSFLQKIPGRRKWHRHALLFYPFALEQFDLSDYDLVISSESGPAKGVLTRSRTCHICYCHTPMRYLWDMYHDYKNSSDMGRIKRSVFGLTTHYARLWDQLSAARVDYFAANSWNVAARIRKFYRRDAEVIYPPVDVLQMEPSHQIDDYYLIVSQLVGYKKVDLAIEACKLLNRPLRIVGSGEEYKRLRRIADSSVQFLGALTDADVYKQFAHCRALLFPGEEDFGMVPVEAQAFGRPVIAYGAGGATETVIGDSTKGSFLKESTGVFFQEQNPASLVEAIRYFEEHESEFSPSLIRRHAERFDKPHFLENMRHFVTKKLEDFRRPSSAESSNTSLVVTGSR